MIIAHEFYEYRLDVIRQFISKDTEIQKDQVICSNHKNTSWKHLKPQPSDFRVYVDSLLPYLQ